MELSGNGNQNSVNVQKILEKCILETIQRVPQTGWWISCNSHVQNQCRIPISFVVINMDFNWYISWPGNLLSLFIATFFWGLEQCKWIPFGCYMDRPSLFIIPCTVLYRECTVMSDTNMPSRRLIMLCLISRYLWITFHLGVIMAFPIWKYNTRIWLPWFIFSLCI